jgi:hypothetical protein
VEHFPTQSSITIELVWVSGFQANNGAARPLLLKVSTTSRGMSEDQMNDFERPATFLDDDEDDVGINVVEGKGKTRWDNLKPSVKNRVIEKGQAKAIANKKKREPASEKKRREF